ncbi:MAG: TonB-dependent receptor, partial [Flavobacteriales bacterium]|nr:TonB-dependent receptor [Flavobacteriales bacterium]
PQVGMSFFPTSSGVIKLTVSRGFRNPTLRELYMFRPANEKLKAESLWNYEISWNHKLLENKLSYGVNVFYINAQNMIQTIMVDGRPKNVNTGQLENYGLEISSSYHITDAINISANYSYLHTSTPVLASPKHKAFISGNITEKKWTATTSVQYISDLYTSTTTPTKESYFMWNIRAGYRPVKWIEIFAKGENLLDQKYEINLGFPMPGATFFGGFNVSL